MVAEISLSMRRTLGVISLACLGMSACASKPEAGEMSLVRSKSVYADAGQSKDKDGKIGSTMKKVPWMSVMALGTHWRPLWKI